jgi:LCP family protein required for cell wall assembly
LALLEVNMADRQGGVPPAGRTAPTGRKRRAVGVVLRWVSAALAVIVVVGLLGAYLKYRSVWNSIKRVDVTVEGHRPPQYTNALNLLVYGSDSRAGLTRGQQLRWHVGANQGELNTDTIMLVHISPGHHQVTVLDIPRDTLVPSYGCAKGPGYSGQQADTGVLERINSVLAAGGPACLWQTVEQQTGIRIDHFIGLNFTGFVHIIDDLGGVNVCVPFNVDVPQSGLNLAAGEHHIGGIMALKFWRTREDIGNGSDIQRIQRDQFLMAQVAQGVLHSGLLSSPVRLLSVITDAAKAMTTDSGLSQSVMLRLASSLRGLSSKNVQFVTAPWAPYPPDPAEVVFQQPQANRLFRAIAHDQTLPRQSRSGPGVVQAASPQQVKVTVLNGSYTTGLAGATASTLASRGFTVLGTGDATSVSARTLIEYGSPSDRAELKTLRKEVGPARLVKVPGVRPGTLTLILGTSFAGLRNPVLPTAAPTSSSVGTLSKSFDGITGSASCKSDAAAFSGPLSP